MISGRSAFFSVSAKACLPAAEIGQRLRARAEIVVGIGQIGLLADQRDRELAGAPALADARIEHRRFAARIGADDQQRVGLLDAGDGGVEQIARPAPRRIERRAVLPASMFFEPSRVIRSLSANISSTAARSPAMAPMRLGLRGLHLGGDRGEGLRPGRRAQPAVLADIGLVEPLRAQAVDDMAGLVGNPFLVHVLVDARQDAHDFAAARCRRGSPSRPRPSRRWISVLVSSHGRAANA